MAAISLVTINIMKLAPGFEAYNNLPAANKIALLELTIDEICEDLKTKAPDQLWIITWREYAVTEDAANRAISFDNKKEYKKVLKKLAEKYAPNLVIVAGTVATTKYVKNQTKLHQIKKYYEAHTWLNEIEDQNLTPNSKHVSVQLNKIESLQSITPPPDGFNVVRNTCYVFSGSNIQRHDKISGYDETSSNPNLKNPIFQPAKGKNINPYVEIIHPFTNEKISIAVEICLEHQYNVAERYKSAQSPFLQIVMSDSTYLQPTHLIGEYIIQADSDYYPRLITRKNNLDNLAIDYYQTNMLDVKYKLEGPLLPCYAFEIAILDKLGEMAHKISLPKEQKEILLTIHSEFKEKIKCIHTTNPRPNLINFMIDELEKFCNVLLDTRRNRFNIFSPPALTQFYTDIYAIIRKERLKLNPDNDLMAKTPALPKDKTEAIKLAIQNGNANVFSYMDIEKAWPTMFDRNTAILLIRIMNNCAFEEEREAYYRKILDRCTNWLTTDLDFDGESILHATCHSEDVEFLEILVEYFKDNIDLLSKRGESALHSALRSQDNIDVIRILLDAGANVELLNPDNKNAKQLAEELPAPSVVKLIESSQKYRTRP